MKDETYLKYAIVQGRTVEELTDALNSKLYEVKEKNPSVEFDGLTARIMYVETVRIPEGIQDEFRLKGVTMKCADCPYFESTKKTDGSVDERTKKGKCPITPYGMTYSDACACDMFYEILNDGGFELCLKK